MEQFPDGTKAFFHSRLRYLGWVAFWVFFWIIIYKEWHNNAFAGERILLLWLFAAVGALGSMHSFYKLFFDVMPLVEVNETAVYIKDRPPLYWADVAEMYIKRVHKKGDCMHFDIYNDGRYNVSFWRKFNTEPYYSIPLYKFGGKERAFLEQELRTMLVRNFPARAQTARGCEVEARR